MQYIIIGIIGIILFLIIGVHIFTAILALCVYLLFDPRINSTISLLFFLFAEVSLWRNGSKFGALIICILLIDCSLDIVRYFKYYDPPGTGATGTVDRLYLFKSLTSLFTFGLSRIVFLVIIGPYLSFSVFSDIQKRLADGKPLPDSTWYSQLQAKNYYYLKHIRRMEKKGAIICNHNTVDAETGILRERLRSLYPKNLVEKLAESVTSDSDIKIRRKEFENKIDRRYSYAYLGKTAFEKYSRLIPQVMMSKGCYSPSDIKNFEELTDLKLTFPIGNKTLWSEYFIIQVIQPLVADGTFIDSDISDGVDNHAYQHAKSTASMPSIDANSNPLLALDDDD